MLNIPGEAVERAKQNHLNFQKDGTYLELTHTVL